MIFAQFVFSFFPPIFVCLLLSHAFREQHMLSLHAISVIWFGLLFLLLFVFSSFYSCGWNRLSIFIFDSSIHPFVRLFHLHSPSPSSTHFSYYPFSWIFIASTMFQNPNLDKTFQLMAICIVFVLFFKNYGFLSFLNWYPWKIYGFTSTLTSRSIKSVRENRWMNEYCWKKTFYFNFLMWCRNRFAHVRCVYLAEIHRFYTCHWLQPK